MAAENRSKADYEVIKNSLLKDNKSVEINSSIGDS